MINLVQALLGQALMLQMKVGDQTEMQERLDMIYSKCQHLKGVLDQHRLALLELRQAVAVERT
jgi:hypothetical protein